MPIVTIQDFTGVYAEQPFMQELRESTATDKNFHWLDCTKIEGTDCYCDDEAQAALHKMMDEAIAKAKADAKAEAEKQLNESIKAMRMTNPYTRKPIESKAEYDEYFQRRQEENAKKNREKLGYNEQEYEKFVSDLPEVQEARRMKAEAEAEKKAAEEKAFQLRLNEEIKNISMLYPAIKSIEDLTKMDNYKELYENVARGYSIEDAFRLVNYDRLVKQAGDKSKQAALNGINGKGHLQTTQSRGQGAIPVPADVKEIYRQLVPDATDAEISEHYNRTHRR